MTERFFFLQRWFSLKLHHFVGWSVYSVLFLQTVFFTELQSTEIRKLVERLINYIIYKVNVLFHKQISVYTPLCLLYFHVHGNSSFHYLYKVVVQFRVFLLSTCSVIILMKSIYHENV